MSRRRSGLSFYQKKEKIISVSVLREILTYIVGIVLAIFLAVGLTYSLGMSTNVVGVSMEPTLRNGQTIYINRFAYTLSKPGKGDVVVFLPNGNPNSHYYVKRVIAVPGDHLQILDGICYVNGEKSPYVDIKVLEAGIAENEMTLGGGEYFCMGDNPNSSEDSRSANIGTVNIEDIIGRAWFHLGSEDEGIGFVD